jgi:pimeloyl-ACP methyl ester carboxylesterase
MPSRLWLATFLLFLPLAAADAADSPLLDVVSREPSPRVALRSLGRLDPEADWTYVVIHGLGGSAAGDRFELLCEAIGSQFPTANVLLVDWSPVATQRTRGLLLPWPVAVQIPAVAEDAARLLAEASLNTRRATLVGESFGNYVGAGIASRLGGVERMLAFNPASELGGFAPPDLRRCASVAWSFHTRSPYDTLRDIAHHGLWLEAAAASPLDAHVRGVQWLAERLLARDAGCLTMEKPLPAAEEGHFRAQAGARGRDCPYSNSAAAPGCRTIKEDCADVQPKAKRF